MAERTYKKKCPRCGAEFKGTKRKRFCGSGSCRARHARDNGQWKDGRVGKKKRTTPKPATERAPPVLVTPAHGDGKLMRGGSKGGGPGRLPNVYRNRFRVVTGDALDVLEHRIALARRPVPSKALLQKMSKDQLITMLLDIQHWSEITPNELRQILDTAAKYGIGTKHVHSGDEDDAPLRSGIIILPALAVDDASG